MSKNYTQNGIGQSTEFGKQGGRVATNPAAPGGPRIEIRENNDTDLSRTAGAPAEQSDEYITFAQFQSQSKWIAPVRALSDVNETLSGDGGTIDGVGPLADGDRVALTNQTNPVENGVWIVRAGPWERPLDFADGLSASDRTFLVQEGATYENWRWQVNTDPPGDIIGINNLSLIATNMGTAGVVSLSSVGTGFRLFSAPDPRQGMIDISSIAQGNGIQISGIPGLDALTVSAEVTGNQTVPGTVNGVLANPIAGATQLRDFEDTATVVWSINGNGNLEATAIAASTGLPYDTIYYVSLTGDPLTNDGLTVNEPTDLITALANANAAGAATVALLDQGTYTTGGTITITGDGVSIVSFFDSKTIASQPVIISDNIEVNASDFTAKGIGFSGTVTVNAGGSEFQSCVLSQGASIPSPSNIDPAFKGCVFRGDLGVSGTLTGIVSLFIIDCGFEGSGLSLSHSGAGDIFAAIEGATIFNSGISLAQTSTGQTSVLIQGCASMGPIQTSSSGSGGFNISANSCSNIDSITLGHGSTGPATVRVQDSGTVQSVDLQTTGTANFDLSISSCDSVGLVGFNYSATGDSSFDISNTRQCLGVSTTAVGGILNFSSFGTRFSGNVGLTVGTACTALLQSSSVQNGIGQLNIGAGWSFTVSDTSFDSLSSTLSGTESTSSSGLSSQFSSIHIEAQPTAVEPLLADFDLLFRRPSPDRGFVESISSSNFQRSLSAGQGIDPSTLANPTNTIQTADPVEATQTPGVNLTLYRPFSAQGNGSVAVGTLPTNARVLQTRVVITSPATAGNADLGYSGGSELQNGATDNDVTVAATYINSNLIEQNAVAQSVTLDFSGMTGTVDGLVVVEYFIAA